MRHFYKVAIISLIVQLIVRRADAQSNTNEKNYHGHNVKVYTTAKNTDLRLSLTETLQFHEKGQPLESEACIFVDPMKTFQTVVGIGGALTDAAAETFYKLPSDKQKQIMQDYFDPEKGIGYTLARTNMQSCDFSSDMYSYVTPGDAALKSFSVAHDEKYRIPFIKQAMAKAGGHISLFISPWSPPAYMKDNNDMLHGGKLKPEYAQAWANFYVKFIKAYQHEGIPVWGLTVQNEPMAKQRWESCIYTAEEERDFVKNYLGPTLHRQGLANEKIIIWDHNRDLLYQRASTVLEDPDAAKYVWGTGLHWYVRDVFDNVKRVSESFPDKKLLFTEGCSESFNANTINEWQWGERYGKAMVNDFSNGVVGWTDWNILLDERGGPNHVGNFCFAPIHANTKTGELTYMNAFYYIGQFSKFVKPGAKRVTSSSNRDELETVAFINDDNKLVVIVLNLTDATLPYNLWIKGRAAQTTSLPHSISTLVIE